MGQSYKARADGSYDLQTTITDPANIFDVSDATRADDDSVVLATSGDGSDLIVQRSKRNGNITFNITGLGANTVTIKCFLDEGQVVETPALVPIDLSTGLPFASSNLVNGVYSIENVNSYFWHFEKSGTDTPTITYMDS